MATPPSAASQPRRRSTAQGKPTSHCELTLASVSSSVSWHSELATSPHGPALRGGFPAQHAPPPPATPTVHERYLRSGRRRLPPPETCRLGGSPRSSSESSSESRRLRTPDGPDPVKLKTRKAHSGGSARSSREAPKVTTRPSRELPVPLTAAARALPPAPPRAPRVRGGNGWAPRRGSRLGSPYCPFP